MKLPALFQKIMKDRPRDRLTDRPTDGQTGSQGSCTDNNADRAGMMGHRPELINHAETQIFETYDTTK